MTDEQKGVQACIDIVKRRQQYYESYRCNCNRIAQLDGHAVGCRAEMMETKPATFATLDDILVHLEAHLGRLQNPAPPPRTSACGCINGCKAWDCQNL
jgi:hypothetical protein